MCAPGTIEVVRKRLAEDNQRRNFLKTASATGAAAAAGLTGASCQAGAGIAAGLGFGKKPSLSEKEEAGRQSIGERSPVTFRRVVDLSHTLHKGFPAWFEEGKSIGMKSSSGKPIVGPAVVEVEDVLTFANHKINLKKITYWEHVGTHMDAPNHFSEGSTCDEIPAEDLVCPLAVIDVKAKAAEDPLALLTPDDVQSWEAEHGPLPQRCCVALNSGWDKHVGTKRFLSFDEEGKRRQPAFHAEAIEYFLEKREVVGIAIDTLSFDNLHSPGSDAHYSWLGSERWGVENVKNLDDVPPVGATIVVGQPKIQGGTGGPNRIFALV